MKTNKNSKDKKETISTIKLSGETKLRLEKLREHKRETYEEIIKKISILVEYWNKFYNIFVIQ